ncbi:oxidoreductase [Gemmatimonadetes bacterium T265]|nr:oxidoreductase [Gemmatimonadetes bacterium T265]
MSRFDAEVLVVGGGPAGASTAWQLASRGLDVLVVDRARFPRDKPCAEYLSPEASRLLDLMGVLGAAEAAGAAQLDGMLVRAPSGDVIHGRFAAGHGFRGFRDRGLALRRRVLDQLLLDAARAAGARAEEGAKTVDVARDGRGGAAGVVVQRADGTTRTLAAPLVVGADGLRSVVGRRLGLARRWPWPRRVAFLCHVRGLPPSDAASPARPMGELHVEADGSYVGIADVGHGLTNVAMVAPAPLARRGLARYGSPAAYLDAWLAGAPQLAPRFARAERATPVRCTGPFASYARRAWAPGAALVGDAAEFFDPFTGEGIYSALRGGELLGPYAAEAARLLGTGRPGDAAAADRALAAYDDARRAAFRGKWRVERLIALSVARPAFINRAARVLSRQRDMADLLVGVAGDFVPPRQVLNARYLWRLFVAAG